MAPKSVGPSSPESFLPLKAVHFHILLSLLDGPAHGYGVRHVIEERTGGAILLAAGTLYETLGRLERDGLVRETEVPDDLEEKAGSRWRFYEVTPVGRTVMSLETARLEADVAAARAKIPATG